MANGIGASLTNYQSNMLREHNRAMDLIPDKASLRRRETRFCGAETKAPKRSQQFNRQIAETKCVHKSPPVQGIRAEPGNALTAVSDHSGLSANRAGAGRTRTSNQTIISRQL